MKKIEVKQNGETKVQEVKMTAKQKHDYVQKVEDKLFQMSLNWDLQSDFDHQDPNYFGIVKATAHAENILQTEKEEIPIRFAFSKPEHCAVYLAFCFGAFDCMKINEVSGAGLGVVAVLKVLTSRKARTEILED